MTIIFEFIKKWLSGFNVSSGAVIGKWLFYAVVFFVFTALNHRLNPPVPVQQQTITAQKVINEAPLPEHKKKFFLGVNLFGWGLGLFAE